MTSIDSNSLCLECGLCCNGVIFANVRLQPGDDAARLKSLGLPLVSRARSKNPSTQFPQPCAAFDGCRCRIYADRPQYCRAFECLLLKDVKAGRRQTAAALTVIRAARRRVKKVLDLLEELGDTDGHIALSVRFRRMQKRLEANVPDAAAAERFSRLTLAVHDLNVVLSESFYRETI